ncbi:hypothetical protein T261_5388 [Streptomyces lydicus]|nr:hypothetical protein T261_5388 [Streptomyces lydicus]
MERAHHGPQEWRPISDPNRNRYRHQASSPRTIDKSPGLIGTLGARKGAADAVGTSCARASGAP